MKKCRVCGIELVVDETWWPSRVKARDYLCIECFKARNCQYHQEHRDERAVYMYQYHREHREEKAAYDCQYREENLEKIRAYGRHRYQEHKEEKAAYDCQYRKKHKEKIAARRRKWERQWYHENLEEARKKGREKARRRYLHLADSVYELYNHTCIYCGSKEDLTLDHVIPLNMSGLHCEDNLVAACQRCNCSKQDKPLEEWLQTQPRAQAWVV